MNFRLRIWRQRDARSPGKLASYNVSDISPNTSFLEMLDILNENLLQAGEEPARLVAVHRQNITLLLCATQVLWGTGGDRR